MRSKCSKKYALPHTHGSQVGVTIDTIDLSAGLLIDSFGYIECSAASFSTMRSFPGKQNLQINKHSIVSWFFHWKEYYYLRANSFGNVERINDKTHYNDIGAEVLLFLSVSMIEVKVSMRGLR